MSLTSVLFDFNDGGIKAMTIVVTLIVAFLVFRSPRRLAPLLSFIVLLPLLFGLFGWLSGQILALQHIAAAGGSASPAGLANESIRAQGCLLFGVLCTIFSGLEAVVMLAMRRPATEVTAAANNDRDPPAA